MLITFSQNLTPQEAFEKRKNKRRGKKERNSMVQFVSFFCKRRKSVKKLIHQKENWGHRSFKIVKFRQSYSIDIGLITIQFITYCARSCKTWRLNLRAQ